MQTIETCLTRLIELRDGEGEKALNRLAAKLMINELLPRLKKHGLPITASPITAERFDIGVMAVYLGAWDTHHFRQKLNEVFDGLVLQGG